MLARLGQRLQRQRRKAGFVAITQQVQVPYLTSLQQVQSLKLQARKLRQDLVAAQVRNSCELWATDLVKPRV